MQCHYCHAHKNGKIRLYEFEVTDMFEPQTEILAKLRNQKLGIIQVNKSSLRSWKLAFQSGIYTLKENSPSHRYFRPDVGPTTPLATTCINNKYRRPDKLQSMQIPWDVNIVT